MAVKALDLFQAYSQEKLPKEGGYIVSSYLSDTSTYSIFEIVAYSNVKNLFLSEDGLTFQSNGNKMFVLIEPPTYPKKYIEPYNRDSQEKIPHRFSELKSHTTRDQSKIMVSGQPIMTYGSFTIMRPTGVNFAFVFYALPDVEQSIKMFFEKTMNQEAKIPQGDAREATVLVLECLQQFTIS